MPIIYGQNYLSFCWKNRCRHLTKMLTTVEFDDSGRPACRAYPKGVPRRIQNGETIHNEIQSDQAGEWLYEAPEKGVDIKLPEVVVMGADEQDPL